MQYFGQNENKMVPTVSLQAMKRAWGITTRFSKDYFIFHGLLFPIDFFKFAPMLVFVEATVYQTDFEYEKSIGKEFKPNKNWYTLRDILQQEGLLDDLVLEQWEKGNIYWELENKVCSMSPDQLHLDMVKEIVMLKSGDLRLLDLILYRLREKPYNRLFMDLLASWEILKEIQSDLIQYKEDILHNTFNIYRMFLKIFGEKNVNAELQSYILSLEDVYKDRLARIPSALLERHKKLCEERQFMTWCGGWKLPEPIMDEDAFRKRN